MDWQPLEGTEGCTAADSAYQRVTVEHAEEVLHDFYRACFVCVMLLAARGPSPGLSTGCKLGSGITQAISISRCISALPALHLATSALEACCSISFPRIFTSVMSMLHLF